MSEVTSLTGSALCRFMISSRLSAGEPSDCADTRQMLLFGAFSMLLGAICLTMALLSGKGLRRK